MIQPEIDRLLSTTLADRRLSGGERDALAAVLNLPHLSDHDRDLVRHRAFALARDAVASPDAVAVLGWLEDVVKLLARPDRSAPAPVQPDAWFSPGDDCSGRIGALLRQAKRTLDVCVFTITDDRLADPLLAAHQRGIAVRILTDDEKSHELGSDVDRLRSAGVPLRMDHSPYHMHHKFAVLDRTVLLTGSYNWTRGAAQFNKENVLTTGDPALVAAYLAAFERLWTEFA